VKLPARRRNHHCTYVTWIMWLLYYCRYLCNIITNRLIESPLIFGCMLLLSSTSKNIEKKRTNCQCPAVVIWIWISRLPNVISMTRWRDRRDARRLLNKRIARGCRDASGVILYLITITIMMTTMITVIILIIIDPPRAMALASELKQSSENDDTSVPYSVPYILLQCNNR